MKKLATQALLAAFLLLGLIPSRGFSAPPEQAVQVAQFDADETYDPFADYSEFDESQDEEADINFFRNGRFVTLGFMGGIRNFTQGLSKVYSNSPTFGLFLSYFFDLRFALQFGFNTSDHNFHVTSPSGTKGTGTVGITNFGIDIKYYINTQNVTKGLAKFNPYFIGGFSMTQRSTHFNNVEGFSRENASGVDIGAGIELPMMRNKMFFGAQGMYQMVSFRNENTEITFANNDRSGVYPNGDTYTLLAILGVNF